MSVNNNSNNSNPNEYFDRANERSTQQLAAGTSPTGSADGAVSLNIRPSEYIEERNISVPLVHQQGHSTSINMEGNDYNDHETASARRTSATERLMQGYARVLRDHVTRSGASGIGQSTASAAASHALPYPQMRSLRSSLRSLNNVISPEIIRSFSHPATSPRYSRLPNTVFTEALDNNTRMGNYNEEEEEEGGEEERGVAPRSLTSPMSLHSGSSMGFRFDLPRSQTVNSAQPGVLSQSNIDEARSLLEAIMNGESNVNGNELDSNVSALNSANLQIHNQNTASNAATAPNNTEIDNFFSDSFLTMLRHCMHYIPFVCILFVKFIYDHLVGIVDIVILQGIMYFVDRSLQVQVAKIAQKQNRVLLRDMFVITFVVISRLLLASAQPDPFGLLITPPPGERTTTYHVSFNHMSGATTASSHHLVAVSTTSPQIPLETTVIIPKVISLETIIYYIVVNDLVLKLITIFIKILITLIPVGSIRYKRRARLFVFTEFLSQFYRALAPIRQWMLFLFESYSGLHAISGVLFSSIYIVLKGWELTKRSKSLKKAFTNLITNMEYAKKPTIDELDAHDSFCPICHDAYNTPLILECGHMFCAGCVTTWFKHDQTCPMCRAKVNEDPTWQDGSTTYCYQLY